MSAAEDLVGKSVPGRRVPDQWEIIERIVPPRTSSNGCRSVGYKVRSSSGRNAFMKAADLQILTNETVGFFERLEAAVVAQRFERNMLDHCRGNNMDRVVVAIDYGEVEVVNNNIRDVVFYLIFELAKCDARVQVDKNRRFDLTWALNTLRNLAVAINQLHSGDVCHNDIKPSNVLVFDKEKQKLADLGCATSPLIQAMHDCLPVAGDPRYAAPEMLYMPASKPGTNACSFDARRAGDLYLLGSVAHFLIVGRMLTPEILTNLAAPHRPRCEGGGWTGNFADVLPYWREAFSLVLKNFEEQLPRHGKGRLTQLSQELLDTITQLGEPNPALRGHPLNRLGQHDRYGVERYISLFDRLRQKALIKL